MDKGIIFLSMEILSAGNLDRVIAILKEGGVIIYPTETTYGIGCDAANQEAVDRIYKIKKRPLDKPVLALVDSTIMARKYWQWNERLEKLTQKYWPGPLTIRARANDNGLNLARGVVDQDGVVALRFSDHEIAQKITSLFGRPLVSTSANIFGDKEVYDSKILMDIFHDQEFQPNAIIDVGTIPFHPPSTLVDAAGLELKILRQGELKISL